KEHLLTAALGACLDSTLAVAALEGYFAPDAADDEEESPSLALGAIKGTLDRAIHRGDAEAARAALPAFMERVRLEPLLTPPSTQDGSARHVLRVRLAQHILRELLGNLPRLGLLRETFDLLRAARAMEQERPAQGRGVTEFNHFFQIAFQEVVETVVRSAAEWPADRSADEALVDVLERMTAPFLAL